MAPISPLDGMTWSASSEWAAAPCAPWCLRVRTVDGLRGRFWVDLVVLDVLVDVDAVFNTLLRHYDLDSQDRTHSSSYMRRQWFPGESCRLRQVLPLVSLHVKMPHQRCVSGLGWLSWLNLVQPHPVHLQDVLRLCLCLHV